MRSLLWPALDRGRLYAFPALWAVVFAAGIGLRESVPSVDATTFLSFNTRGHSLDETLVVPPMHADTAALIGSLVIAWERK